MESTLMMEALKLLVLDMGFVYLFLGIMVLAIKVLAFVAAEPVLPVVATLSTSGSKLPPATVAAITAAVHTYRLEHTQSNDAEHKS